MKKITKDENGEIIETEEYDDKGNIVYHALKFLKNYFKNTYDDKGNLIKQEDLDSNVFTNYIYNDKGLLIEKKRFNWKLV